VLGDIWHAVDEHGTGPPAFKRLAFGTAAEVTCRTLHGAPGPRTIEGKWEALLMDSAREHDEESYSGAAQDAELDLAIHEFEDEQIAWPPAGGLVAAEAALAPRPAPTSSTPGPTPLATGSEASVARVVADEFTVTRDRAVDALLVRDYATAAQLFAVAHALRPEDGAVAANLERLAALGFASAPEQPEQPEDHDA